jgi:N-acetylglucosaminyldiphosphoundecaprenol N-acetyl-beta-D-mannosaminyltransferase
MSARTMRAVPRVTGPDVFCRLLDDPGDLRIALVGGNAEILDDIEKTLHREDRHKFLLLDPRSVDKEAVPDPCLIGALVDFRPDVVFVGLGCPKQERWVAQACSQVDAVFIGVGAAFNYRAGRIQRAPQIMQRLSLEWAYRSLQQPKLIGRYLRTGAPFLLVLAREVLAGQLTGVRRWSGLR